MDALDSIAEKYKSGGDSAPDPLDAVASKVLAYYETPEKTISKASGEGAKSRPAAKPIGTLEKVGKGMIDPIEGGAQLLYNAIPQGLRDAGDSFNNWLADKTGLVAKLPQSGFNGFVSDQEKDYQDRRTAAGESGFDGMRLAGNVLSPANLAIAGRATAAANALPKAVPALAKSVISSGVTGGAQGAMTPVVTDGDYWDTKKDQTLISGGIGAAIPFAGKLLPKNTAAASELKANGIDVPLGQSLGGMFARLEDKLTSVPLLGDTINANRQKAIEQFNIATLNKALEPIKQSLDKGIQAGHEAVANAAQKVSNAYNTLLPKLNVKADGQFVSEMSQLKQLAGNLPQSQLDQFNRIIANEVEGKFTQAGLMSGETMKTVERELGRLAKGYGKAESYADQELANALRQAQSNLRSMVERNNPQYAGELQNINRAFAMLQRPERAASYLGAESGQFTPAQLLSSVKANDQSLRHKMFAKGDALMQDWAEKAKGTLSSKIPDSGTAGRVMAGAGGLGGMYGYVSPDAAIGLGALTAAYLPGGRQIASGLLGASEGASKVIANRAPYATLLLAPPSQGLLGFSP